MMKSPKKRYPGNERGGAMVITLIIIVFLIALGSIFVLRSINEKLVTDKERYLTQAYYLAEAGAESAIKQLNQIINTDMLSTINLTNPQTVANKADLYVNNDDALGFLILYAKLGGTPHFTLNGAQAVHTGSTTTEGNGAFRYDIIVTQKTDPIKVATDVWDFLYYYQLNSTGTVKNSNRKVNLVGDFTVRVQRDNFARYALFTDHHTMPSGSTVWFTNKTNFAGPIHTNDKYSFAFNPSGIFDGVVTQQNTKAQFYNNGNAIQLNADSNGTRDVPVFNSGYSRGVAEIVLASSVQKQDLYDQARAGESATSNGIYVANNGGALTGGIYVKGDSSIQMGVDGSDRATYTITQGATTKTITVDRGANQTTVQTSGGGTQTYNGIPDGVDDLGTIIYVNGNISSLKGTVQKDTEVTVSSEFDINITDNLTYADYNPAVGNPGDVNYTPPDADGKTNLLGMVAWGGDVSITTAAPNDVNIHGIVMARNGVFQVDNYDDQNAGSRGTATVLGGSITQFYGAFGQFNSANGQQISGYGRNFNYDSRTQTGKSPPYFPSMKTFIAFTNDITDKIAFQEGGF